MRKYYLDNLRFSIVLLVVLYHVIYIFNSVGVITNISVAGIKQMDTVLYLINPWFMPCLFLISGISARYALQKKTTKQFMKSRVVKLLVPSIAGIFILGWISGYITSLGTDIFGGNGDLLPGFIKYFIYSMIGAGPLWFAHQLFLASIVLMIIIKIDKKDKIWQLGKKVNMPAILLLFFPVWGSSLILNTPLIEVYRHGIYIFLFLLGYYVFSHEHVTDLLAKWRYPLLIMSLVCGAAFTIHYYGDNYTSMEVLKSPLNNIYLWLMTLTVIGCSKVWFNKKTKFTTYMAPRSFAIYVLHYPILVLFAYIIITNLELPIIMNYILLFIIEIIAVPLSYELIVRIPVLNLLLLGISSKKKTAKQTPVLES